MLVRSLRRVAHLRQVKRNRRAGQTHPLGSWKANADPRCSRRREPRGTHRSARCKRIAYRNAPRGAPTKKAANSQIVTTCLRNAGMPRAEAKTDVANAPSRGSCRTLISKKRTSTIPEVCERSYRRADDNDEQLAASFYGSDHVRIGARYAHCSPEAPCRGKIGDQRIGQRLNSVDADTEQRCHQIEDRQANCVLWPHFFHLERYISAVRGKSLTY